MTRKGTGLHGKGKAEATRYTANGFRHTFRRAVERAGLDGAKVTPHTMRHTVLSRRVAAGHDDHTVMEISGHRSTRMLQRYTHPQRAHCVAALQSVAFSVTNRAQPPETAQGGEG